MTKITDEQQAQLDRVTGAYRSHKAYKATLEREAADRIALEMAALERELANKVAGLASEIPKRRIFMALGVAPVTLDALIAKAEPGAASAPLVVPSPTSEPAKPFNPFELPGATSVTTVSDTGWTFTVNHPVPSMDPTLMVSNDRFQAEAIILHNNDGSLWFDVITPEENLEEVRNVAVVGLVDAGSTLYAEAKNVVEEWEKGR